MFLIDLLEINDEMIDDMIYQRASAPVIQPELVRAENVKGSVHYKRLKDPIKKDRFRKDLLNSFRNHWNVSYGNGKALELENQFKQLLKSFAEMGALIFGEIITKNAFEELIKSYDLLLKNNGSNSWIHSYVNLVNQPKFLTNPVFNKAFLHPLLIALISYRVGGPIRIVGARLKDANPISVMAQDNMLHIDNSPFADEYKIILTWEKNKSSGPKGQNFVFIPGTHQGLRNSFQRSEDESIWSTENASIFIRKESLEHLFNFQKEVLTDLSPMVVEACHYEKPLTIAFAAGSLVHHRYRTDDGMPRSCIILAFRLAAENEGQFLSKEMFEQISSDNDDLNSFLFNYHGKDTESRFINALTNQSTSISQILDNLMSKNEDTVLVDPLDIRLTPTAMEKWKSFVTNAPSVEKLKSEKLKLPLGKLINQEEMFESVKQMMMFDKHGPMDMILYSDNREEIRKFIRNSIREMNIFILSERLQSWLYEIEQPIAGHLLTPLQLKSMANDLVILTDQEMDGLDLKLSACDSFRSVRQTLIDLSETVTRCESKQSFLSTCLFMFWTCDFLNRLPQNNCKIIKFIGHALLMNYIATGILIEKHRIKETKN